MRKIKQIAALFVCVVMIASLFTFSVATVSAQETLSEVTVTEDELLVLEKLQALGVIKNEYTPSDYITRREMAEIIKSYIGLPEETSGSDDKQFNDVAKDDSSYAAISALRDLEIISGDEKNNFRPDDYLNYNEAVVFIINAIGHKYFAVREGGYPTGYMRIAIKHDMLDNIEMTKGTAQITVIDVYKMLDSALTAATVIPQYYGDGSVMYTISETENFLSYTYGIREYRGKVTGNEFTNLSSTIFEIDREQIEIDRVVYDTPGYYYGYFLGYTVNYYIKHTTDGDEMVYIEEAPRKNSTIKVDSEDILASKTTSSRIYYIADEDGKDEEHIVFEDAVDVIYNNQWYSDYGVLRNILPVNGYIEALDNDNDGICEVLFVYDYTIAIVDSVDGYDEKIYDKMTNAEIDLSTNVRRVNVISSKSNASVPFATIQKDDVLSIAMGKGAEKVATVYVCDNTVTGTITGYASNSGYEINGEYYEKSYNYDTEINSARVFPELEVGMSGVFHLDMSGKIAAYKYSSDDDTSLLAVIAGVDYNENSTMNRNARIKLFTQEGKFIEVPFAKSVRVNDVKYDMTDVSECDTVLNILCDGYSTGGKYSVYDSYVLRYVLSKDEEITFIDTGAVGGAGNLNSFADHYMVSATRVGIALFGADNATLSKDGISAKVASNISVFTTPVAGELHDERGYSVSGVWMSDASYANPSHKNSSFNTTTTLMDNLTAYHMGESDNILLSAVIVRGAGLSAGVSDDSGLCVITDINDSVDADGTATKTLYENKEKIGQLAADVTVSKGGTSTIYTVDQLLRANVLSNGAVVRCGLDNDGYISNIAIVAEYDENTETVVPTFGTPDTYASSYAPYSVSKSNLVVGTVETYDSKNSTVSVVCGEYEYLFTTDTNPSVKIYNTETGKIRTASAAEIRDGDSFVMRTLLYYKTTEMVIFR